MTRQRNDANFFPELRCTQLKINIETMVCNPNCHFNHLIERVSLYHSAQRELYRYVLVVETTPVDPLDPEYPDLLKLKGHWEPGIPRWLFGSDFREVYKEYSPDNKDFNDWFIWQQSVREKFPKELVLKGYRWLLFERPGIQRARRRRNQLAYDKVREFAAGLFEQNPCMTTADVISHPGIDTILNECGVTFTPARRDKTLREWIQNLNPKYNSKKVSKGRALPDPS